MSCCCFNVFHALSLHGFLLFLLLLLTLLLTLTPISTLACIYHPHPMPIFDAVVFKTADGLPNKAYNK